MQPYQFTPHTAEIILKVNGQSLNKLLIHAGQAIKNYLDPKPKGAGRSKKIRATIEAVDAEGLLLRWISEVVFWIQTKKFIPKNWRVILNPKNNSLKTTVEGTIYKEVALAREVKSATYHNLKIRHLKRRVCATVILDV